MLFHVLGVKAKSDGIQEALELYEVSSSFDGYFEASDAPAPK